MATGKWHSELPASADHALLQEYIQSYRDAPDKYLEKWLKSGSPTTSEAARRVLEERAKQTAEEKPRSEDVALVAPA